MKATVPATEGRVWSKLFDWQRHAVEAWEAGDGSGARRGTLEVFTGGGKTLLALAAWERFTAEVDGARLIVVVPSVALADQWKSEVVANELVSAGAIAIWGGARRPKGPWRALICVLPTAAKLLPSADLSETSDMLVIDECHRAGSPVFSNVLRAAPRVRLGLSATPEREEVDENGDVVDYDDQLLGRRLGRVVYRFDLARARQAGWLPRYQVNHHGTTLSPGERARYDVLTRRIDDVDEQLRGAGVQRSRFRQMTTAGDEIGKLALQWQVLTGQRKDLLYRSAERSRIAVRLTQRRLEKAPHARVLLFHERTAEAEALHEQLRVQLVGVPTTLEHSGLTAKRRAAALDAFATGAAPVLVSVKALVEGVNVPAADTGIVVAASSSVRQRVQSLGRVLRRRFDGTSKDVEIHLLYVADTVDDVIYGREDWRDLLGEQNERYWSWPHGGDDPEREEKPPRLPLASEEEAWQRIADSGGRLPALWTGLIPVTEYSMDHRGNVSTGGSRVLLDEGDLGRRLMAAGFRGGRFRVTPRFGVVVAFSSDGSESVARALARVPVPLRMMDLDEMPPTRADEPSDPVQSNRSPLDRRGGTIKFRSKQGGVIERRRGDGMTEWATTDGPAEGADVGARLLESWKALDAGGLTAMIATDGKVWFMDQGKPRVIGQGGDKLAWPSEAEDQT